MIRNRAQHSSRKSVAAFRSLAVTSRKSNMIIIHTELKKLRSARTLSERLREYHDSVFLARKLPHITCNMQLGVDIERPATPTTRYARVSRSLRSARFWAFTAAATG